MTTPCIETIARKDHEKNCRNEPPWPGLTVSHRDVHDMAARRIAARQVSDSPEKTT